MNIGIPNAGKSTFSNALYSRDFMNIRLDIGDDPNSCVKWISTDLIIEDIAEKFGITYNDCFNDLYKFAENMMNKKLSKAISNNCSLVWDQTNLSKKSRAYKIRRIPKNYCTVALYYPIELESALVRNQRRIGKVIPEQVVKNMFLDIEEPEFSEGFDHIYTIRFVDGIYSIEKKEPVAVDK
jgi:tRNA uridine 5-carbamoylmethylation protein Kti12